MIEVRETRQKICPPPSSSPPTPIMFKRCDCRVTRVTSTDHLVPSVSYFSILVAKITTGLSVLITRRLFVHTYKPILLVINTKSACRSKGRHSEFKRTSYYRVLICWKPSRIFYFLSGRSLTPCFISHPATKI